MARETSIRSVLEQTPLGQRLRRASAQTVGRKGEALSFELVTWIQIAAPILGAFSAAALVFEGIGTCATTFDGLCDDCPGSWLAAYILPTADYRARLGPGQTSSASCRCRAISAC